MNCEAFSYCEGVSVEQRMLSEKILFRYKKQSGDASRFDWSSLINIY